MTEFIEVRYNVPNEDIRFWLNTNMIESLSITQNGEIAVFTIHDESFYITGTDILSLQDLIQQASKKIDETPPTMTSNRPF